jgi:hypothetical protein
MMSILDRLQRQVSRRSVSEFRPVNTLEYFAFRLAVHLGEPLAARHYAELAEVHSIPRLLAAFHNTRSRSAAGDLARHFHRQLQTLKDNSHQSWQSRRRLLAIRIERRTIATVLLNGDQIEAEQVRHLSSDNLKAAESAAGFIDRLWSRFHFESAALEDVPMATEVQRMLLHRTIRSVLTDRQVSIWPVNKREVFTAFGYPPPRSRRELRDLTDRIFPWLNGGYGAPFVRDAAALGLFCQTERHFLN